MNAPAVSPISNGAKAFTVYTRHAEVARSVAEIAQTNEPRQDRVWVLRAIAAEAMQQARAIECQGADPAIRARRDEDLIRVDLPGQPPRLFSDADASALRDQLEVALHVPPSDSASRLSRL